MTGSDTAPFTMVMPVVRRRRWTDLRIAAVAVLAGSPAVLLLAAVAAGVFTPHPAALAPVAPPAALVSPPPTPHPTTTTRQVRTATRPVTPATSRTTRPESLVILIPVTPPAPTTLPEATATTGPASTGPVTTGPAGSVTPTASPTPKVEQRR